MQETQNGYFEQNNSIMGLSTFFEPLTDRLYLLKVSEWLQWLLVFVMIVHLLWMDSGLMIGCLICMNFVTGCLYWMFLLIGCLFWMSFVIGCLFWMSFVIVCLFSMLGFFFVTGCLFWITLELSFLILM